MLPFDFMFSSNRSSPTKDSNSNDRDVDDDDEDDCPQLRPSKGLYHYLLSLLSNPKIKVLTYSNVALIGPRASNLPTSHSPLLLQSFQYLRKIYSVDDSHLANIIFLYPHLVDLSLGAQTALDTYNPYGFGALRELVECGVLYYDRTPLLDEAILRSAAKLEVLSLRPDTHTQKEYPDFIQVIESTPLPKQAGRPQFVKLTRLELFLNEIPTTLVPLAAQILDLALVHLGINQRTDILLSFINLDILKSLSLTNEPGANFEAFLNRMACETSGCQIESLMVYEPWESNSLLKLPV
ncbi:hypothetical protein BGZ47_000594 [Haplosporangium gracile]|nr:hypothetical protein BGZ47_000594 [Haplosporangium gracile]